VFKKLEFSFWFAFGDDTPRAYRPQPNTEDPDAPNGPPNPDGENAGPGPCGLDTSRRAVGTYGLSPGRPRAARTSTSEPQ
jgi:hypothetical protein